MKSYQYIIIGGGMTGDSAARGIRDVDEKGSIAMFSMEPDPPYNRPPLTKGLWKGKPLEQIFRPTGQLGVDVVLRCKITDINARKKRVTDDQGNEYEYDKLLLATGGQPRKLPFGGEHVLYYRYLDGYRRLRSLTEIGNRYVVIGGGFIGSEIGAALAMNGNEVVMLFMEDSIGARLFPAELARYIDDYYRQKGVVVLPNQTAASIESSGGQIQVKTSGGQEYLVNGVVAGLGIIPSTELAQAAGLQIDNGVIVDEQLRTSNDDIFAAGDVASFYSQALGKRRRVEHEDNANTMGLTAGRNMAHAALKQPLEIYDHQPYFYSDMFDLGYEAVGELDPKMEVVEDWQEKNKKGVLYYLKDSRVRGVLLWNVWSKVDAARQLIASSGPYKAEDLKGKI